MGETASIASEQELQPQLHHPWQIVVGRDSTEGRRTQRCSRIAPVRVIGGVEELRPELEVLGLGQAKLLGNRSVQVARAGPDQDVSPGVSTG